MYGYLHALLILFNMIYFTTSYDDFLYNRATQRASDPNYAPNYPDHRHGLSTERREIGHMHHSNYNHNPYDDFRGNIEPPIRHTYTSTKVSKPPYEGIHNPATTVRSYVKQESFNNKNNFFNSTNDSPDLNRNSNKRKSEENDFDGSRMVYPSDFLPEKSENPTTEIPKKRIISKNCTFGLCDEVMDYPSNKLINILSRNSDLQQYFTPQVIIDSRIKEDGDTLCPTSMRTLFPKSATNVNNVERVVVNVDNYKQGIVYEECQVPESPCTFSETFPNGYVTSCKQKFTQRRLMVLGDEKDNPVFDNFPVPSCCVCTVKKV